jgi:cytochrome c oxidase subunit 2
VNELMRKLLFLPEQASTVAKHIDWLHYFVITVTMLGATGVAAFTLYFIIRYRERPERPAEAVRGEESKRALPLSFELFVFGGLLATFILWWVIGFAQYVRIAEPPPDSMTIYVTGKQWMWSFAYPNGTGSNGVLYVPAGRPVKLVMTSRDVIHSFFVPSFRLKRDVVPGQATTMWFEVKHAGRYPVYCAEYCGAGHSTMRAEVVALAPADYDHQLQGLERLASGTSELRDASLAAIGERVAATAGCFRCHTPDGTPHIGPTWAGLYGTTVPLDGGRSVVADEAYLTRSMMDPAVDVHLGFKPVMPSYQGVITSPDVAALVEYIRSLRDVSPSGGRQPLPAEVPGNVPLVNPPEAETRGAMR